MSKKRILFLLLCLAVAAVGIGYLTFYFVSQWKNNQIYEELQDLTASSSASQTESEKNVETVEETASEYVSPIDFEALQEINPDIYAWIEIPDTQVAYPVVQHATEDTYYLNHTVEGESGYPGSIYTHLDSAKDFTSFNTVIYGHNMKNGTMFGGLKSYRDEEYLKEHRYIYIYTPEAMYTYEIFAAVIYNDLLLTSAFDFEDTQGRQAFLDSIYAIRDLNSHVLEDVEVTTDSRIITLSTCVGGQDDKRYLVEAVLIDEQK